MRKITLLMTILLAGCSTFQHSPTTTHKLVTGDSADQQALLKKAKAEQAQDAKDRKLILSKQGSLGLAAERTQTLETLPTASGRPGKKLEVTPRSILTSSFSKMPEGQLYSEVVDRYQAHDLYGFEVRSKAYIAQYSRSERLDEVVYLRGLSALAEKGYGEALLSFNRILKEHPHGKKAPSALFAKGITFQRMNLKREAKLALGEVLHRFPGSPESMRAKAELKIIK